ncbi:MAG: bifunctional [glutamate--ammonia ligase]-adenylyl-L-tyrosine phosphorylase/[glutamate--ammonia-ligase] adenylyltransferase [Desulfuromonadales bacterium]|nr:bifunctional [glutamate--ammonia ligase]-adenylyl-L-tyrosine phosphorylase/[glutamate--ammonia-ligase] adenylyltransferase [Desulfuromonadales bacterium]MBN2792861.1 bifunctional [glutamate--ammonia ligase]-adenylyl-L-tyrosine phosphorylase/[glutamate--ammonia-ligase] adenylyltransferase [Desulfuromonadales bacterium]
MVPDRQEISTQLELLDCDQSRFLAWLDDQPLLDAERARTNLKLIDEQLRDRSLLVEVTAEAFSAADPDYVLNALERLFDVAGVDVLAPVLKDAQMRRQLLTILGGSPFLAGILFRHNDYLQRLFHQDALFTSRHEAEMLGDLRDLIKEDSAFDELQYWLRRYKSFQILRIGSRDLCGLATLEEVMEELSGLAAASLQRAYEVCSFLLQQDYGQPLEDRPSGDPQLAEMTVLGMGKFGGNELNFSSDIDLIYCYSSSRGETTGGRRQEKLSLHRYFVKLAEKLTRALHQVTEDGFVFRVDTRLRPDGNNGDLAVSLDGAEIYYESWGQSWERAALIKARPVAGSIALGKTLLQRLKPFVYRRYLDFGMIEDIKIMKQKINASLSRAQEGEGNLKLGHGGIREIEFFIQAQQLVNAGRKPRLQYRNSLRMLALLEEEGLIEAEDRQSLGDAYRFLRQVEHRIQIVQEQQTHTLPQDQRSLDVLARRCGFSETAAFLTSLATHRERVSAIFKDLFHTEEEQVDQIRPEVVFIFDPESDPDLVKDLLEEKGFANPNAAYDSLLMLRGDDPRKRLTRRGRRCLDRLMPQLMTELLDSPNPDQALGNLEAFLRGIRARTSYFSLLVENPATVKLLIALFGSSQFLSRIFIQRPELLDTMVSRSHAVEIKDRRQLGGELAEQMALAEDYELKLDSLRRFRNEEFLRIALNDLHGQMRQGIGAQQLSWLAEVCLEEACRMARQELVTRFGAPFSATDDEPAETAFAIIAMGKLGGLELNYHSDLDIIFIYACEGQTEAVAGTDPQRFRQISNHEYFAKLAQRIITVLTLATREGAVYQIDTRLRPSGNQGPLVTSLEAFTRYHQETAQPWERQAMTKARAVCGPPEFLSRVQETIATLTFERPLPENLKEEIYRLRGRMENEIARENGTLVNIKTGRGGMVDVEFITQYLQLLHAGKIKALRIQNTINLLESMIEYQILPREDGELLISGYKYLRRLENKLRLLHDQSINEFSSFNKGFRRIARSLGYGGSGLKPEHEFLEQYHQITEEIRALLEKYLNPEVVA